MATWTRQELETLYPDGSVSVQVDDTARVLSTEEWSAWIDRQVGIEKLEETELIEE
jgi:trans-2-enoyl-CoA reductase